MKDIVENLYPLRLELSHAVNGGITVNNLSGNLITSTYAVKFIIEIDDPSYPKGQVYQAVKEICQKAVEYYC